MARKVLIVALGASTFFEIVFAASILFAPGFAMQQFGLTPTPDLLFVGYGLGWTLLVIGLVCGWSFKLVRAGHDHGHTLARLLGFWWIVVGLAIFFKFGKIDNLFADSLKGLVLVVSSYLAKR